MNGLFHKIKWKLRAKNVKVGSCVLSTLMIDVDYIASRSLSADIVCERESKGSTYIFASDLTSCDRELLYLTVIANPQVELD